MRLQCKRCREFVAAKLGWVGNKTRHIWAWCPKCGQHITTLRQTPANLDAAGPDESDVEGLFTDVGGEG